MKLTKLSYRVVQMKLTGSTSTYYKLTKLTGHLPVQLKKLILNYKLLLTKLVYTKLTTLLPIRLTYKLTTNDCYE